MAFHIRKQIRDKFKTLLTGLTTTATRVYTSRVWPVQGADLPGLLIYTPDHEADPELSTTDRPRAVFSYIDVAVVAVAKSSTDVDDQVDLIEAEVCVALFADYELGGLAFDVQWVSSSIQLDEANQPTGQNLMIFRVSVRTHENDPTVVIT